MNELNLEPPRILFRTKPSLRRAYVVATCCFAILYRGYSSIEDPDEIITWICQGTALGILVLLAWVHLVRWTTTYVITTDDVQSRRGILRRRYAAIPHARITNTNADQTLLDRILGLTNVSIDSAGGDKHELLFSRILKKDALKAVAIVREMRKRTTTGAESRRADAVGV